MLDFATVYVLLIKHFIPWTDKRKHVHSCWFLAVSFANRDNNENGVVVFPSMSREHSMELKVVTRRAFARGEEILIPLPGGN
jgi:hypothetical protein